MSDRPTDPAVEAAEDAIRWLGALLESTGPSESDIDPIERAYLLGALHALQAVLDLLRVGRAGD